MTGVGLSEEEGPYPQTPQTQRSSSSARLSPSIEAGKSTHGLGRRHDVARSLIRIWIDKAGAGQLDQDVAAADLLVAYEAKIAALERLVGQQAPGSASFPESGAQKNTVAGKRAHLRDHRPDGLSIERGCALMDLPRSTFYAALWERPSEAALIAEIRGIADEFECYGYRRVGAELRHRGQVVNAKKLRRLMRENALNPRTRRRFTRTADSGHDGPIFPFVARGYAGARPGPALGRRTSPTSGSRRASSISPSSSSMPGPAGSSGARSPATSRRATASPRSRGNRAPQPTPVLRLPLRPGRAFFIRTTRTAHSLRAHGFAGSMKPARPRGPTTLPRARAA